MAYAAHQDLDAYQIDVKCTFLNGVLEEIVFVEHPPRLVNDKYPNHCYILEKSDYAL